MTQIAELEPWNNPYESPLTASDNPVDGLAGELPVDELRAFVGPKSDHYLRKWAPRLLDPQGDVGVSWIAFFFPNLWLAYRKMFMTGLLVWFVGFGIGAASSLVFGVSTGKSVAASCCLQVVVSIVCCLYGNAWYLNRALREIQAAHAEGHRDEQLFHVLSRRGGTSVGLLVAMFFLCGFLAFIGQIMLMVSLGAPAMPR